MAPPQKTAKKKKGFSLTPEKKKLLKQLIMQKAAEELKKQQEKEAAEKKAAVESRVPKLEIDGLDKTGLEKKVKELYAIVCRLEDEKYEWESRLGRQTEEINELNIKVNDVKGKFSKPMLKKVNKSQKKFDKAASKSRQIAANLKSTGQPKFAIEEEDKKEKHDLRDQLKHSTSTEAAPEEQEEEEEEEEEEE